MLKITAITAEAKILSKFKKKNRIRFQHSQ